MPAPGPVARPSSYTTPKVLPPPTTTTATTHTAVPDPLMTKQPPPSRPAVARARAPRPAHVKDTKASHTPSVSESRLSGTAHQAPLLGSKIADLVASLDASFSMEAAAEDQLLTLVDDFVDKVVKQSMRLANHRSSKSLDVVDVQMVLAKQWGIVIPGLGPLLPKKRTVATAAAVGTKRRASDGKTASASHYKVAKTTAGGEKAVA